MKLWVNESFLASVSEPILIVIFSGYWSLESKWENSDRQSLISVVMTLKRIVIKKKRLLFSLFNACRHFTKWLLTLMCRLESEAERFPADLNGRNQEVKKKRKKKGSTLNSLLSASTVLLCVIMVRHSADTGKMYTDGQSLLLHPPPHPSPLLYSLPCYNC